MQCNRKPCDTPIASGVSLTDDGDSFSNPSSYRTIIGSLQYLTYTRSDIAFVVNKLSQLLSTPKLQHWPACKQLLRYPKGTIGLGFLFSSSPNDISLVVYTDADHAGCKVTRRFTSGFCVFLGKNLIVWGSKKLSVVARSIGEAKYQAIALGVTELLWMRSLFSKLGYPCTTTSIVLSDNLATKSIAKNPVFHSQTKHIEIDIHFVREKVKMVK